MFKYLKKKMKGETIVEKLSKDFDLLSEFRFIEKNIPNPSYAQSAEIDVVIIEMMAY